MALASLILTPLALWRNGTEMVQLTQRDWLLLAAAGVCLGLHFATWISSLSYTSVASSVVLVTTSPFFVGLGAHFLLRERVPVVMFVGVALAVVGGALIGWGDVAVSGRALWGDVLALAGALAASAYYLIGRSLRQHMSLLAYVTPVYWVAALVACAMVLCANTLVCWLVGRVATWRGRTWVPPAWQRIWLLSAPPVAAGILVITMTCNEPTLRLGDALCCAAAALAGLALALMPGAWAATRPKELAWLALDGLGLVPVLMALIAPERAAEGLVAWPLAWGGAAFGLVASAGWLALMSVLRAWRRVPAPRASVVFLAGLAASALLLPLLHHVAETPPGYRYISASANFFARSPLLQAAIWGVAAALALGTTRLRLLLARRSDARAQCAGGRV